MSDNFNNRRNLSDARRQRHEYLEKERKKDKLKTIGKSALRGLLVLVGIFVLLALLVVGKFGLEYGADIATVFKNGKDKVANATVETFNSKQPTKVIGKNGDVIYEFKDSDYIYTKFEDLNPYIMKAFIAIEDNRFLKHSGMDYIGTTRALIYTLTGKAIQGGSSITQQLAKNVFLTQEQTLVRKIEEAVISSHLERKFTKEEIFEFYVNNIYYGHGNYSFESASQYYFQKSNKDLSIGQIAILAGVINNPTKYDPINKPEGSKHRRDRIIGKMLEEGFITQEQHDEEVAKDLELNVADRKLDNTIKDDTVSYAIDCATEVFMEQNGFQFQYEFASKDERVAYWKYYNEEYKLRRNQILTGGYEIHTVIDDKLNKQLQNIANKYMSAYTAKNGNGIFKKQVSMTIIDNATGEVVGMVGGRGQDGDHLNRAYQAPRQPGSAIKPLVAYAPAFEKGYIPSSVMVDAPIVNGPKNSTGDFSGSVTLRYALEKSINTIPYRLASSIGGTNIVSYLANMEFQNLTETDYNPILAVGGFTKGVTTEEMSSALATLARGGEFIKPTNITKITKINTGDVIYENSKDLVRVYDEGASYLTTDSMKGVLTQGTGTAFKPSYPHVAGKTGTTNQQKDRWMVGFTPYYTVSVWVGDDTPRAQSSMMAQGYIWRDTMNLLHKNKKVVDFVKPDSVTTTSGGALVNSIYLNKKNNNADKRKKLEAERIKAENETHIKRLEDEDYRIKYGLTREEELEREYNAEQALSKLENYTLSSESQFEELSLLLDDAYLKIEEVKHKKAYDSFMATYNSLKEKFNNIKNSILNPVPEPTPEPEPIPEPEQVPTSPEQQPEVQPTPTPEQGVEQTPTTSPDSNQNNNGENVTQ